MKNTNQHTPSRILAGSIGGSSSISTEASRRRRRSFKLPPSLAAKALLALVGLLAAGTSPRALAATATFNLGAFGSPTTFTGGTFTPWSLGVVPAGNFLQSVSINATIESTDQFNWASELMFLVQPNAIAPGSGSGILEIGPDWINNGNDPNGGTTTRLAWPTSANTDPVSTVTDFKAAILDFPSTIDLSTSNLFLMNAYGPGFGAWSGTVTITYGAAAPSLTWTGADATSPTQWTTAPGVLNWSAGAYTDGSAVTFDDSVGAGSRLVDISSGDVSPAGATFNTSGTYSLGGPNAITGATGLTMQGGGLLVVQNTNTYSGPTLISAGTLQLGNAAALPHGAGKNAVRVDGTLDLNGFSATINGLIGTGTVTSSDAGGVTLTAGDGNASSSFTGLIQDGSGTVGLTKTGTGTLTLTGLSTYTGKTTVLDGTLYLGIPNATGTGLTNAGVPGPMGAPTGADAIIDMHNGTTLQTGDTNPRVDQTTNRTINLAGTGPGTVSLKFNDNDTNFTLGAVTATGTGAKTLAVFTGFRGNGDREAVIFSGAIADGASSTVGLEVTYRTQTGSESYVSLTAGGTFTGPINLIGTAGDPHQYFLTVGGTRTRNTNVPGSGSLGTIAPGVGSYAGNISLGSETIFYYNSSAAQTLSGSITGAGSLTKAAAGTLTLTAPNSYTGLTTVTTGALNIQHATALGTAATGTTVDSGAALQLQGGIAVNSETLALNGTGISASGALRSISGDNIWRGLITLNSATRINSEADSLTFEISGINGTNTSLTIGGAGDTTITAHVNLGAASGSLSKDGAGLLNIDSGAQTYKTLTTAAGAGATNVNVALTGTGGTNVVAHGNLKFGSVSQELNSLTIGAGATVTFTSDAALGAFSGGGGKARGFGGTAAVPEPGTLGLLLVGALSWLHRRRRQA